MRQLEDVRSWLSQPNTGTVETAGAPFWRLALHMAPDLRLVTIRRDPDEAAASAVEADLCSPEDGGRLLEQFWRLDKKLGQIEKRTGCRSFRFDELHDYEVCRDLFEYLLPYKLSKTHWSVFDHKHITTDVPALKRYVAANLPQIGRLQGIARQKSLAVLASKSAPDPAGLTLDFMPFRDFLRDCSSLIQEHMAEVGEDPEALWTKNLDRFQKLDDSGALQVTVGRCNGRAFGYLITALGESLQAEGRLWACHTAFYASAALPGLGLRLRRKADDGLRARGVFEVVGRAGSREGAERQGVLYLRDGYEPFGTYYRLQLGEAS